MNFSGIKISFRDLIYVYNTWEKPAKVPGQSKWTESVRTDMLSVMIPQLLTADS